LTIETVKAKIDRMSVRALQNSLLKSFSIHLLLLVSVVALFSFKEEAQDEPISLKIVEKSPKNESLLSDKANKTKQNKLGKKAVTVSDLGVKLDTKSWSSRVMEDALNEEEEPSLLSTRESLFYAYFERVHDQLYRVWDPILRKQVEKLTLMGREIPLTSVTKATITIDSKGHILKVQLLQESGFVELDSAALLALNEAGPYPNPPQGLMDENGNAQLPWAFILKN
jgi:TonB family protein